MATIIGGTSSMLSKLPIEILNDVLDMSNYWVDYVAKIKKHFRENVLPEIDPTILFLGNNKCHACALTIWGAKASAIYEPTKRNARMPMCMLCRCLYKGDRMVSAHCASMAELRGLPVLESLGFSAWLQTKHAPSVCKSYDFYTKEHMGLKGEVIDAFSGKTRATKVLTKVLAFETTKGVREYHDEWISQAFQGVGMGRAW